MKHHIISFRPRNCFVAIWGFCFSLLLFALSQGVYAQGQADGKPQLTDDLFTLTLPAADITYDGQAHGVDITTAEGVGKASIYYLKEGNANATTERPVEAGNYIIFLEIAEGERYAGRERSEVGTFSIYQFSEEEWVVLQSMLVQFNIMGWSQPWDMTKDITSVSSRHGLTIEKGHVTGIDIAGQDLTGMFPFLIHALPHLKRINLSGNSLSGDIGEAIHDFAQKNPTMMETVQSLDISDNRLSGNIGRAAISFPQMTTLNASGNCLEEVNPMIPITVTSVDISRQDIARVVPLNLNTISDDIATKMPNILLYDHNNQTFTPNVNMMCKKADDSWEMMMAVRDGEMTIPYVSENNTYYGENGGMLNVTMYHDDSTPEGSTLRITLGFDEGDANFDGQVNVLDLQTTILYIMERFLTRPYNFTAANLWNDSQVNVQDIIRLVNLLMGVEPDEARLLANARLDANMQNDVSDALLYVSGGKLILDTKLPVAALDIIISGTDYIDIDNTLKQMGITFDTRQQDGGLHIIAYSLSGTAIPTGSHILGTFGGGAAKVRHAMLSDGEAKAIPVSFSDTVTGIVEIDNDSEKTKDAVYDLLGRKVSERHMRKSLLIRNGRKVIK